MKPMPLPDDALEQISLHSARPVSPRPHTATAINFADEVTAHRYPKAGDQRLATHEHYGQDLGDADEKSAAYRDPYAERGQHLHVPHSATIQRTEPDETFRTRIGRFQSTPDLSLQDPRQGQPKKHKVKEFFQHHQTPATSSSKRSVRSRIKDGDESETEGLVTSPRNDFGEQQRNSMEEPWDSHSDSGDSQEDHPRQQPV
jgi:hypothetical protein